MSRAILTIHGFLTDINDFGRLYDYLDMYDEVKACEIPGHNGEVDFSKFTFERVVDKVLTDFDELAKKHGEVDVIGFSMGGALCSYLCAKRNVRKAVMVSPANKYLNLSSPVTTIRFYLKSLRKIYGGTVGSLKSRVMETHTSFAPLRENVVTSSKIALKRILPNLNIRTFDVFRRLMNMANNALDENPKQTTPALIMWGKLDELVPYASVEYLSKRFVKSKIEIYNNVGHAMLLTNCDNVLIPDIVSFLTDGKTVPEVPFRGKTE